MEPYESLKLMDDDKENLKFIAQTHGCTMSSALSKLIENEARILLKKGYPRSFTCTSIDSPLGKFIRVEESEDE